MVIAHAHDNISDMVRKYNTLALTHPELTKEWNHERNGSFTPEQTSAGSAIKVWWKCSNGHPAYEWRTSIYNRTHTQSGCPVCAGRAPAAGFNDLATTNPALATEWNYGKNNELKPNAVLANSTLVVWWKCSNGHPAYEWPAAIRNRTRGGSQCPVCAGRVTAAGFNDLQTTHTALATEWNYDKNGELKPEHITAGSTKVVWWKCSHGHEWSTTPNDRTRPTKADPSAQYQRCPACTNRKVVVGFNDLATTNPVLAKEWHPHKNGELKPEHITAGSTEVVWWKCSNGHEWSTRVRNRAVYGSACGSCPRSIDPQKSLATLHPRLAAEWDNDKNGGLRPEHVTAGSNRKVWWKCPTDPTHPSWSAVVKDRVKSATDGCSVCRGTWSDGRLLTLVEDMVPLAHLFTDAEVMTIAEAASGHTALIGQRLLRLLRQTQLGGGAVSDVGPEDGDSNDQLTPDGGLTTDTVQPGVDTQQEPEADLSGNDLAPGQSAAQVLAAAAATPSIVWDDEAVAFIVASQVAKLWAAAYADLEVTERDTREPQHNLFAERVRSQFRAELDAALQLQPGPDWAFAPNGQPAQPNLMQRHVAALVRDRRLLGNWSDTGTGKTAAAVLAARTCRSGFNGGLVLVICPNNVIDGWKETILGCYPNNTVVDVRSEPDSTAGLDHQRWRVVNFETFSLPRTQRWIKQLLNEHRVDMIVIDEVHLTKKRGRRSQDAISLRRGNIYSLRSQAAEINPDLRVLASSATPVINDLSEAVSLLEMLCGMSMDDIKVTPSVPNAIAVHRQLVLNGVRWRQDKSEFGNRVETLIEIDAGHLRDSLAQLSGQHLDLHREQVLLEAKLPAIVQQCKRPGRTMIYTYYVEGVVDRLRQALEAEGIKTAEFSGTIKQIHLFTGIENTGGKPVPVPQHQQADVLIGTSAVSLGIDGLQSVADRLVFATLPWTHAEYEQVVGRLWRQGRLLGDVEVVLPVCTVSHRSAEGETIEWSSCRVKWARVRAKGALAAAAVDGKRPNKGELESPAKVARSLQLWLQRLRQQGAVVIGGRHPLTSVPPPDGADSRDPAPSLRRFGQISAFHSRWHNTHSRKTHQQLLEDPRSWYAYHEMRNELQKQWQLVPAHVFATWLADRSDHPRTVADLGCGDAALAKYLNRICPRHPHRLLGFDHIAIDEPPNGCSIEAADISSVPLEDKSVDVAVLSLALWGTNHMEYLQEARRILRVDGLLWLAEPISRVGTDKEALSDTMHDLGFKLVEFEIAQPFALIQSIRTTAQPQPNPRPVIASGVRRRSSAAA